MKAKWFLALLPAVCLCGPANLITAQQRPDSAEGPAATGRVAGVFKDPAGAVVLGARIEVKSLAARYTKSTDTDQQERFVFGQVPAGRYQLTVAASGFDIAVVPDLAVTADVVTTADVALKIAPARASVEVNSSAIATAASTVARRRRDFGLLSQ